MKNRIKWVDIIKFFGIFTIYLGHFGEVAGLGYAFVYSHHVPLFFLVSGCMEIYNQEKNLGKSIIGNVKKILIPFFFFGIVSIVFNVLLNNISSLNEIKNMLISLAKGAIRNDFFAGGLWFLTCLFVIKLEFYFIKKVKIKSLIIIICLCMYYISERVISPRPILQPHWIYNIDSSFYYIIFYAIGYVSFPKIQKLFQLENKRNHIIFYTAGIMSILYAAFLFFGKDFLTKIPDVLYISLFIPIVRAVIVIWMYFFVARCCNNIQVMVDIGKNTLYLCGTEYIIKNVMACIISTLCLGLNFISPISVYIYTYILLLLANKYFVPIEKRIIMRHMCLCKNKNFSHKN